MDENFEELAAEAKRAEEEWKQNARKAFGWLLAVLACIPLYVWADPGSDAESDGSSADSSYSSPQEAVVTLSEFSGLKVDDCAEVEALRVSGSNRYIPYFYLRPDVKPCDYRPAPLYRLGQVVGSDATACEKDDSFVVYDPPNQYCFVPNLARGQCVAVGRMAIGNHNGGGTRLSRADCSTTDLLRSRLDTSSVVLYSGTVVKSRPDSALRCPKAAGREVRALRYRTPALTVCIRLAKSAR